MPASPATPAAAPDSNDRDPGAAARWDPATTRRRLTELAAAIGFDGLGLAAVAPLPDTQAQAYEEFRAAGYAADMAYLHDHPAARVDPIDRWPWARTVLVLAVGYDRAQPVNAAEYATGYPVPPPNSPAAPPKVASTLTAPGAPTAPAQAATPAQAVARYAQGRDYHRLIENALRLFKDAVVATPNLGIARAHYHCDTGPVLERPWAHRAGIGWQAKNGLIIRPGAGSFCFLAELFLDRALPADPPATDHCGSCTRCIDACPTDAIVADRVVDPRRCISYLNIERRDPLTPEAARADLNGWLFGCDICQNVCPHNTKIGPVSDPRLAPADSAPWPQQHASVALDAPVMLPWYTHPDRPLRRVLHPDLWRTTPALAALTWQQAVTLSEAEFDALKQGTALRRVPYENFKINAAAAQDFWRT